MPRGKVLHGFGYQTCWLQVQQHTELPSTPCARAQRSLPLPRAGWAAGVPRCTGSAPAALSEAWLRALRKGMSACSRPCFLTSHNTHCSRPHKVRAPAARRRATSVTESRTTPALPSVPVSTAMKSARRWLWFTASFTNPCSSERARDQTGGGSQRLCAQGSAPAEHVVTSLHFAHAGPNIDVLLGHLRADQRPEVRLYVGKTVTDAPPVPAVTCTVPPPPPPPGGWHVWFMIAHVRS